MRRLFAALALTALLFVAALPLAAEETGETGDRLNNLSPSAPNGSAQEGMEPGEQAGDRLFNLSPAVAEARSAAPRIGAIEIRSDAALDRGALDDVRQLVTFEVGDELTEQAVARTLRNLETSGVAAEIGLYTRPDPDSSELVAVVVLRPNLVVTSVRIEGDLGALDRDDLSPALAQRAGEPLIETRILRGFFRMSEILEEQGYFDAVVRPQPTIDEAARQAEVVYRVEAGPRSTVTAIAFDGEVEPFSAGELREVLRTKTGEPYRQAVGRRDAERLERWLVERDYRTVRVDPPRVERSEGTSDVRLVFPLILGPKVEVVVTGAEVKRLRKRELLPFMDEGGYDEALLLLAEERLRDDYQQRGHYDVAIDAAEERTGPRSGGTLTVRVAIDPGPVFSLADLRFEGNEKIDDDRLRELISTRPAGILSALPLVDDGRLVDSVLADDLDNLAAFYALEGYVDAEVGPPLVERDGNDLTVIVPIEEGERQTVASIDVLGVESLEENELRRDLPLTTDGPFHPRLLDESLNRIRERYERQGYDSARVSASVGWDAEHLRADVLVRVLEGPQTVVDRVIVRGNRRTNAEIIRQTLGFEQGQPISRSRLLEGERELYRLGVFSSVDLSLTPAPLGSTTRDVVVRVEEGLVRSLRYGVSAEYNDEEDEWGLGGTLGFSHRNLFGRAIAFSGDARVLSSSEQYRLFIDSPDVFGSDVDTTYTAFRSEERRTSFNVERRGVRVEALRAFGERERLRVGLAYDYRVVDNSPREGFTRAAAGDLEREDQRLRVAGLIPSLVLDYRDDALNPHEGFTSIFQVQYTFPLFAAEAEYLKLFAQHSHYLPVELGNWRPTFAVSLRAGGIEPLAPLPPDIVDPFIPPGTGLPSEEVFLAERFFAGGESSHRAYQRDRLGIPFSTCLLDGGAVADDCAATLFPSEDGDLSPAGGNGLVMINLDLRIPVFGALEVVPFLDAGNVWADWRQIDAGDFRYGTGIELRYASPVGPLRVGVGFPLDPVEGADEVVYFLSLGAPF